MVITMMIMKSGGGTGAGVRTETGKKSHPGVAGIEVAVEMRIGKGMFDIFFLHYSEVICSAGASETNQMNVK
jgi:hypothetical protein